MVVFLLIFLLITTLGLFLLPKLWKYPLTLLSGFIIAGASLTFAIPAFFQDISYTESFQFPFWQNGVNIRIDRLSAFFMLVINFTCITGFIYARSYLKAYMSTKSEHLFSLHYTALIWLQTSMLSVTVIDGGFAFLVAWELMSVSSFLLVIFDAKDRDTMKAGINYLIQMHVGFLFLLVAFLIIENATGVASFDNLTVYFSTHPNIPLFALFFIGFGIKAGFMPLHTWLPMAHPAAPSHVSGIMSGVMIKMGIYGIVRVLFSLQDNLLEIGAFVLIISIISGLLGVMFAIVQHDLKRLLAYHSIENIGIIGIGLGLGLIGKALNMPLIEVLGFSGGLLHVLNHSLFKSLLFYNAGSVYIATHTRNIEHLGGLIKKMPYTAILFLIGSLAICGLPPFNGFISEYLIYSGLFKSLYHIGFYESTLMLAAIIGLALIGGLAIFCFTKAFGIVFLGNSRSDATLHAKEIDKPGIFNLSFIVFVMLLIGLLPVAFVEPIFAIVNQATGITLLSGVQPVSFNNIMNISIIGGIFVLLVTVLLVWRYYHLKRLNAVSYGPTWGCGYTAGTAKHQYTATSFADNFSTLAQPILQSSKEMESIKTVDIFPTNRHFQTHQSDVIKKIGIDWPIEKLLTLLKKIAVMQTGQIQHYILYAFIFMLLILVLTFFNFI